VRALREKIMMLFDSLENIWRVSCILSSAHKDVRAIALRAAASCATARGAVTHLARLRVLPPY